MKIIDTLSSNRPFISLEFFPPKSKEGHPAFFAAASRLTTISPAFVSVTYGAGGGSQDATLDIAQALQNDHGFETMAHLTCVGADEARINEFLDALSARGVSNVLALRGDPPEGQDEFIPDNERFKHASDLVDYIKRVRPDFGVAAAAYPECHPESESVRSDLEWTKVKASKGVDFFVSQLFFDNRAYFDFVQRLRGMNVEAPVIPGILPILSLGSIRRILSLCGAAIPGRLYLDLEKAHNEGGNDAVRALGINHAVKQAQHLLDNGAPGIHLYTLNQADACLEIVDRLSL
ncbi:methylenetetrahydrofolate reductase [NAD(P)H] [Desulfovibrio inopinatus]|uniref:methylenetetrahydrofolate reductase [NAD(P)H] n=1 Tax=Desulfovibrio inopinatus TaxID=102109 RepID=UPI0004162B3F|nr:methylenetetrahydrofolate reductase [NAD(P)H] [Desulfovibrio inopinatus]